MSAYVVSLRYKSQRQVSLRLIRVFNVAVRLLAHAGRVHEKT